MKKFVLILVLFFCFHSSINASSTKAIFKACVDGDTAKLVVDGKTETVRFLAIDTPETKHPTKGEEPFGKVASNYTCLKLKTANTIKLEFEKEKRDKYDRLLAWVFVDDKLLQDELIKKGYASVAYLYDDYKYTSRLQAHEAKAKIEKKGKWNEDQVTIETIIQLVIAGIGVIIAITLFFTNTKYRKKYIRKGMKQLQKKISS